MALQQARAGARTQTHRHQDKLELMARIGYATKGVIYVLFSTLMVLTAIEGGRRPNDSHDAILTLARQPYGTLLLCAAGVGLIAYAAWRMAQALADVDRYGTSAKGLFKRVFLFGSGIVYGSLAVMVAQILMGSSGGSQSGVRTWISMLLEVPGGMLIAFALGLGLMIFGVEQAYSAYTTNFESKLKVAQMSAKERRVAYWTGRIGLAARAIVFLIIGGFIIKAAIEAEPSQARGMKGALAQIAEAGPLWLGLIAAGLVAYGVLQLVYARYRRFPANNPN